MLKLFLARMELFRTGGGIQNLSAPCPVLNKEREREILAKVQENSGELEQYAYYLFFHAD